MNLLHMKYALEVSKAGSLGKAAENLLIAAPNISRSIKELEANLGITIFERTPNGMKLTPEGEEFICLAKSILSQIDEVEKFYKGGLPKIQRFSVSVPRACYICEAFAKFSKSLSKENAEIFFKETSSQQTITGILNDEFKLGIIRYADNRAGYFKTILEERGFQYELVAEFSYVLIMSENNALAQKSDIFRDDLKGCIEISHADPDIQATPLSKIIRHEQPNNITRRIYVYDRASQLEILSGNPETFMWVSPAPDGLLKRYGLIQKKCADNREIYKDMLIYKKGYKLSKLDKQFITELCESKRKYL